MSGDTHLVDVFHAPYCGAEPNGNVVLEDTDLENPDVLDAVEVCEGCLETKRKEPA